MLMRARCRIGLTKRYFICFDPREAKNLAPHGANPAGHFSFLTVCIRRLSRTVTRPVSTTAGASRLRMLLPIGRCKCFGALRFAFL